MTIRRIALLLILAPLAQARPQAAADEQYRFLAGLAEKGMHELAVQEAQEFLRDHPQHAKAPLARYRLAGALWELGKREEAAREYEILARAEGFEYGAECLFRCGEAALARGDLPRARTALEAVLAAGQDYLIPPALFSLGEAAFHAGNHDEAERRYAELLRAHPGCEQAPLARRALAWCAWQRGDAAETVVRARAALEQCKDPAQRDELHLLCGEALLERDPRAALEAFRSVRTAEQADARGRGEGFALAALGDHAGAARAFEGALASAPQGRHAREVALQAGIERLRAGEPKVAVQRLSAAARSGDAEALYWLAQAHKTAGDPRAALASLDLALRAKPAGELEGRIHVLRGDCLSADGRGAEALAAYEKSGSGAALLTAAITALNQGDLAGAARLAERVVRAKEAGPQVQGARVVLAEASFAAQRYDEAERALEAALEHPAVASVKSRRPRSPVHRRKPSVSMEGDVGQPGAAVRGVRGGSDAPGVHRTGLPPIVSCALLPHRPLPPATP